MDLSRELTRGGVRGGREQFKWDSLKSMSTKEREHYLGSIVHVGVPGKFGQSNKHDWWRGDSKSNPSTSVTEEKSRLKAMEAELMQEALGLKPKRLMLSKNRLSSDQVEDIIKKEEQAERKDGEDRKKGAQSNAQPTEEDEESATHVRGFGYRKYVKDNEWNAEQPLEDLDGPEEVIQIKREVHAPIKREEESRIKSELPSPSRRARRRSRSPYSSRRY